MIRDLRIRTLSHGEHVLEQKDAPGKWRELDRFPTVEWAWVALQQALTFDRRFRLTQW